MHPVKIDEAGIGAAFDAAAAGLDPAAAAGLPVVTGSPDEPPAAEAWKPVTGIIASMLANKVCPAWEVSQEVQGQWADALGECLDQLLPGGLANIESWGPWGKLAFASSLWIMAGVDLGTMTLKPRYPLDPDEEKRATQSPGAFTTDA